MPIHGEYRMQAANARMAQEAGVPAVGDRPGRERLGRRAEAATASRIVDQVEAGVTFVDGLGVGDIGDVALRDRRHMAEDGVLIVVATLASSNGARSAAAELIARGFAETRAAARRDARRRRRTSCASASRTTIVEIKLLQEHLHDGIGQLVYDRTRRRPMILPVVVEV